MTILENKNYKVDVGQGTDYEGVCYLISNVLTGVVEVETRLLPQALMYAKQLNEAIEEEGETPEIEFPSH